MDRWSPLVMLVVGWMLGLASSFFVEQFKSRRALFTRMFEHYLAIRAEITDLLSELAQLDARSTKTAAEIEQARRALSKLFFKHYDFLPAEVLIEMNCLYACLKGQGNHLFRHSHERGVHRLSMADTAQLAAFVDAISLVQNHRYAALLSLQSEEAETRRAAAINCQARSVLTTFNRYFVPSRVVIWEKMVSKQRLLRSRSP